MQTINVFDDNIMKGFAGWSQPYRFVVWRRIKWDPEQVELLQVVDDPAMAYLIAKHYLNSSKDSIRQVLFDYFLTDSFNKDAVDFCKSKYEKAVSEGREFAQVLLQK